MFKYLSYNNKTFFLLIFKNLNLQLLSTCEQKGLAVSIICTLS